jgi:group I intron endonuclease
MGYIYKTTNTLNQHFYIGKKHSHKFDPSYFGSGIAINNAIKKYGKDKFIIEVLEWVDDSIINEREIFYIEKYNARTSYNIAAGGEGVNSELARTLALRHHKNMSKEQKKQRSDNCSRGQQARFKKNPESNETKQRKSKAHQGKYLIEAPDGRTWTTDEGLKKFANDNETELGVGYWQLFGVYRKGYTNKITTRKRKDNNNWKVTRIDKPNS